MSFDKNRHIVVLMMENWSLDNMLDYLYADQDSNLSHVILANSTPLYDGHSYSRLGFLSILSVIAPDRNGLLWGRQISNIWVSSDYSLNLDSIVVTWNR